MGDRLVRKGLVVGIIFLFIGMSVIPSTSTLVKKSSNMSYDGKTLYVGGSGPGNYTKIKDAIDDAVDGDTIFVYNGVYYENLLVNKSVILTGEDKYNTIIDGSGNRIVVNLIADGIILSGFTIQNSGGSNSAGILISSDYNNISGNVITNNTDGIWTHYDGNALDDGYNVISENIITYNMDGIGTLGRNNTICRNNISHNLYLGIVLEITYNNKVFENIISDNEWGILTASTHKTVISRNIISNSLLGIELSVSSKDKITQNNFIGNRQNAYFYQPLKYRIEFRKMIGEPLGWITWDKNYWNGSRLLPKPIFGYCLGYIDYGIPNFVNFDWHPAQKPYEIMAGV